jgi:serine protease Do
MISPLTEDAAKAMGLASAEGVLIGSIEKDGPAEKAGLKEGDIIQQISDKKIMTYQDLLAIVTATEIGKTLKVTVWREKKNISFWVTVKERP